MDNVVPISAVRQSDSILLIRSFFKILFHYGLSQEVGYSSLCDTVGPCCLSILNVSELIAIWFSDLKF